MNENEILLILLDAEGARDLKIVMAKHAHAVKLCRDAAERIRELEAHIRYYSNCNEPMTDMEVLKSWRENQQNS